MLTLRRILVAWGVVCVVGWLVLGGLAESEAADCRAKHALLCFNSGASMLLVGMLAAAAWLVVAVVATVAAKLTRRARSRRS